MTTVSLSKAEVCVLYLLTLNVADIRLIVGLCVDLPNGVLTNANQVQTWQCTDGNVNQIWTL